jgi:hypothetical protein
MALDWKTESSRRAWWNRMTIAVLHEVGRRFPEQERSIFQTMVD